VPKPKFPAYLILWISRETREAVDAEVYASCVPKGDETRHPVSLAQCVSTVSFESAKGELIDFITASPTLGWVLPLLEKK